MKAKTIEINAAHGDEIPSVFIKIRRHRNPETLDEARRMHKEDAEQIHQALYDSLPAATFDVLVKLMIPKQ